MQYILILIWMSLSGMLLQAFSDHPIAWVTVVVSGFLGWKWVIEPIMEAEDEKERKELEGDRPKWLQDRPPRVMKEWKPDFIPENTNHPVKCPNAECDEVIAPEWKFCNRCGLKVR